MTARARWQALAVFSLFFGLYLWTSPPTLSPYRDAGEMSLSAYSLGVSHPPGYPLYILLGHAAQLLGLGTPAYRLAVLSALAGAGALALLFAALRGQFGSIPAAISILLLGSNSTFWSVCQVQEMYSLTLLLGAGLLALAFHLRAKPGRRAWYALAFLYGVSLGNRTDLLLWLPGLLLLCYSPEWTRPSLLGRALGFGALGLSVYFYLPLRSWTGPWLDWNHPATLYNFIGSLTRRGYGGTLDLISKNYEPGAMFLPNMAVYARHLWHNEGVIGLALAAVGAGFSCAKDRRGAAAQAALYLASGPLFLYLANMPPNPHALAIVEPHYLLSDVILALWTAEGAAFALQFLASDYARAAAAAALAASAALVPFLSGRWAEMDRRGELMAYDYAHNVLRSAPPGSVVVAKKDVQLFSLWYYRRVSGLRADAHIVAQGLAHSPWYQESERREGVPVWLGPLRDEDGWKNFLERNGSQVYATTDADIPPGIRMGSPRGMLLSFSPFAPVSAQAWRFMVLRGDYRYGRRPDFFTSDLVEAAQVARQRLGASLLERGQNEEAERELLSAWAMKRTSPETLALLSYLYFHVGNLPRAAAMYGLTIKVYEDTLDLARRYRALPSVRDGIAQNAADACLNLGVVYERLKDPPSAERMYRKALELYPSGAKAHFNMAVLYWGKDWRRAESELEAALSIDPHYQDALRYLPAARAKAGM